MPQRKQIRWAQLRVGLLVLVSMIVLGLGIFFITGQVGFFSPRYTLKSYFASAGGVREGSEVRLAGIAVGNVEKIRLSPYFDPDRAVEIDVRLTRKFQPEIRADSTATIETAGLLGDAYIDISRGGEGQAVLPNDGELKSHQQADIKHIVQNADDVVSNLRVLSEALTKITDQIQKGNGSVHRLIYDETFYNRLNDTTAGIDRLVADVEKGQGTLGKFMVDDTVYHQTTDALNHLNKLMDEVEHGNGSLAKFISDPSVYNDIKNLTATANTLVNRVNQGQGTLGKLVNDPQLYNRMDETLGHFDTVSARMEKGEGTLGKLSSDATLFNSMNESAKTLREFLVDFQKNPKKYLTLHMHIF